MFLSSATSITARRSPIYSVRPLIPCCGPYAGGSNDCIGRFLHRWSGLHPFCKGSATTFIHAPDYAWPFSRRCNLRFMLRPGTWLAPLRTGRLLPSLHAAGSPRPHVDYDYTSFRLARGRTFTGWSDSLMGCTQNRTKREGGPKTSLVYQPLTKPKTERRSVLVAVDHARPRPSSSCSILQLSFATSRLCPGIAPSCSILHHLAGERLPSPPIRVHSWFSSPQPRLRIASSTLVKPCNA